MIHQQDIPINKISWLKWGGGKIKDLFYPESINELIDIVKECNSKRQKYYVFGHTSNSYFLPSFSPEVVISIIKLRNISEDKETVTCECGVHSKALSKLMVEKGVRGFEGLIDLPGTISGAIYGNAGCYDCLISDQLLSVQMLLPTNVIIEYKKWQLGFSERSSFIKDKKLTGIILTATFRKEFGNKEEIQAKAKSAHEDRLVSQPGPTNNLGSIFKRTPSSKYGIWIGRFFKLLSIILHKKTSDPAILRTELQILGYKHLIPYVYNLNRFIWKDENGMKVFNDFVELHNKMHIRTDFEIEIFE